MSNKEVDVSEQMSSSAAPQITVNFGPNGLKYIANNTAGSRISGVIIVNGKKCTILNGKVVECMNVSSVCKDVAAVSDDSSSGSSDSSSLPSSSDSSSSSGLPSSQETTESLSLQEIPEHEAKLSENEPILGQPIPVINNNTSIPMYTSMNDFLKGFNAKNPNLLKVVQP
jgi:hypothetical protein